MVRWLAIGLSVAIGSTNAQAQIGNVFGNSSPATAQSAWSKLPGPLLACVDQTLRQQGSSVNYLIQQNTYPNSPQYQAILSKCQQDLRPKIIDASQAVRDPAWKALTVEQKLGYFGEVFWVSDHHSYFKCREQQGRGYAEEKGCLASNGLRFEVSSPQRCYLTMTERVPPRGEPTRTWDGKVASAEIVGRQVTFPLSTLDDALIQRSNTDFELYFEVKDHTSIVRSVALSNDPAVWITLPSPPILADVPSSSGNADERRRQLLQRQLAWSAELKRYGDVSMQGLTFGPYFHSPDTNSEEGLKRIRDNEDRRFLKWATPYFSYVFRTDDAVSTMTGAFVEAIKSVISDCGR